MNDLEDWQVTNLTQRLYQRTWPSYKSMLGQQPTPAETLHERRRLYVNKVGGYCPDPTDEIVAIENTHSVHSNDEGFTGWLRWYGSFYECTYGTITLPLIVISKTTKRLSTSLVRPHQSHRSNGRRNRRSQEQQTALVVQNLQTPALASSARRPSRLSIERYRNLWLVYSTDLLCFSYDEFFDNTSTLPPSE